LDNVSIKITYITKNIGTPDLRYQISEDG